MGDDSINGRQFGESMSKRSEQISFGILCHVTSTIQVIIGLHKSCCCFSFRVKLSDPMALDFRYKYDTGVPFVANNAKWAVESRLVFCTLNCCARGAVTATHTHVG